MDPANGNRLTRSTDAGRSVVVTAISSKQAFQRTYPCILLPPSISRAILETKKMTIAPGIHPAVPTDPK